MIARATAAERTPRRLLYDGVFAVALRDGLCHEFREWWNSSSDRMTVAVRPTRGDEEAAVTMRTLA